MTNDVCVVRQRWDVMNIQLFFSSFISFFDCYLFIGAHIVQRGQSVCYFLVIFKCICLWRTVSTERPNTKYGFRNRNGNSTRCRDNKRWRWRWRRRPKRWVAHQILNYSNLFIHKSVFNVYNTRIFIAAIHLLLLFLVSNRRRRCLQCSFIHSSEFYKQSTHNGRHSDSHDLPVQCGVPDGPRTIDTETEREGQWEKRRYQFGIKCISVLLWSPLRIRYYYDRFGDGGWERRCHPKPKPKRWAKKNNNRSKYNW